MRFHCLADEETVRAFRLAGIPGQVVPRSADASALLDQLGHRSDIGILIITDQIAGDLGPQIDKLRLQRESPLIVEIPGPRGPAPRRRGLHELVQAAVGISVEPRMSP